MVIDASLVIALPWQYAGVIKRVSVGTVISVFSHMMMAPPSTRSQSLPTMGTGDLKSSASRQGPKARLILHLLDVGLPTSQCQRLLLLQRLSFPRKEKSGGKPTTKAAGWPVTLWRGTLLIRIRICNILMCSSIFAWSNKPSLS